ncbi:hypothetical protein EVAR_22954_1 [Eumeta japonica]|uniref:Uncharacterized protein n=1 Tax=Eumeta variegata TaxID=151549 RepID=A0A4C1UPU8_EUMVA|nr:hypothetical protein EVAR_22954_1 [Eumeta japonica]
MREGKNIQGCMMLSDSTLAHAVSFLLNMKMEEVHFDTYRLAQKVKKRNAIRDMECADYKPDFSAAAHFSTGVSRRAINRVPNSYQTGRARARISVRTAARRPPPAARRPPPVARARARAHAHVHTRTRRGG